MKKLLAIVVLGLLFSGSANAEKISCRDIDTNEKFTVLYNSNEIKAFGKIFDRVFVSGNSILGSYTKYKKKLFGQKVDEYWKFNLSFDGLSMLTRGKYIDGEYEWLFQKYFSCG